MEPKKSPVSKEVAMASQVFDSFCAATTLKSILGQHRHLCELLRLKPSAFPHFYPKLKSKLCSWRAKALWAKFDKRASHKCYNRGRACPDTKVLIIGAGPCGLRTAIEAQLLGAKVVVVEKRDRISRHNVLHLWPFVIHDLKALNAKKFFGKFCAGAIDHISIRQLQCILLKVALILGVEFHEGVGFEALIPPPEDQSVEKTGWRAKVTPAEHPVSQYEFDVLVGADGKRNTLEGFKRKEFRGKLAIAITANFINRHTEAEARVEEISGVAFIFNQKFFKDLYAETGIDLENIVYYKDETHYFVMTAKKHSLISSGVILNDYPDTVKLLSADNKDQDALMKYARDAAEFSTNYIMRNLEFAVDHYGQPDVAMFDFTSMFAAENASRVVQRSGHRLLQMLVGDSLLEPFWPTGSGCARGFLSSMDACWAVRSWAAGQATVLEVLAERESIYRILGQTTPENLQRDYAAYTLDPHTRYPNLNKQSVTPVQVKQLFDTDDPGSVAVTLVAAAQDMPKKRRRKDSHVHPDTLLHWLKKQVALYDRNVVRVENVTSSFKNGLALCAIIHRYRPDLVDFHLLTPDDAAGNNQLAFDSLERELGVPPVMTGLEMEQCDVPDKLTMLSYLSQVYDTFRGEIPHVKHPKLEPEPGEGAGEDPALDIHARLRNLKPEHNKASSMVSLLSRLTGHAPRATPNRKRASADREGLEGGATPATHQRHAPADKKGDSSLRKPRKRRSQDKVGSVEDQELAQRIEDIRENRFQRQMRREYIRKLTNQQFYKSMQMLQTNSRDGDDIPFEDYSLFVYRQTAPSFGDRIKEMERKILYPDREARIQEEIRKGGMTEENLSDRVKIIEDKLRGRGPATDKKPKDLNRAIGKIEKSDWNVKEIEKKIEENKMGRGKRQERGEKVPKWSREQFDDKFQAMKTKLQRKGPADADKEDKYADIDVSLKRLDRKIREGSVLDMGQRGSNKVSALAEQLAHKTQEPEKPAIQKSSSKAALVLPSQGGSEACHFCNKRVYLMERLSAEGKFFHRGCFRCEYCTTTLRLGNYAFDRDGRHGSRFFCTQHFGQHLPPGGLGGAGGQKAPRVRRKSEELLAGGKENVPAPATHAALRSAEKGRSRSLLNTPSGRLIVHDSVDTAAVVGAELSEEEDPHSEMDEDEWTDVNFGASAAEGSSDSVSDISDSEEEPNEVFEEALGPPEMNAAETRRLAETWTKRYSGGGDGGGDEKATRDAEEEEEEDDEDSESYDDDGSDDGSEAGSDYDTDEEDSDTATEGEDEIRARELRKLEVPHEPPPKGKRSSDTGSDTEVATDEYSSESDSEDERNSATEISTDSEFEHDGTTPTQHEIPCILIDDTNVTFRRRAADEPKRVQVRTGQIGRPVNGTVGKAPVAQPRGVKLEFKNLRAENETVKSSSLTNLTTGINNINNNNTKLTTVVVPTPLINPRRGDYLLNRTLSTEGIASKLSLELKKKYLLGPSGLTGSVKKSGSASTLDSTFKSVVDVISEQQKLLKPAPELSPSMQAFLQGTSQVRPYSNSPVNPLSPSAPSTILNLSASQKPSAVPLPALARNKDISSLEHPYDHVCALRNKEDGVRSTDGEISPGIAAIDTHSSSSRPSAAAPAGNLESRSPITAFSNVGVATTCKPITDVAGTGVTTSCKRIEEEADCRPRSPVHETSIVVPDIPWKVKKPEGEEEDEEDMESDSLSSEESTESDDEEEDLDRVASPVVLKKERTPPRVEIHDSSGEVIDVGVSETRGEVNELAAVKPNSIDLFSKKATATSERSSPSSPPSNKADGSESLNNEATQAALTETEWSDWAHDGDVGASDDLDDAAFDADPTRLRRRKRGRRAAGHGATARMARCEDDFDEFDPDFPRHVCGKKDDDDEGAKPKTLTPHILSGSLDNIEFMDTGEEDDSGADDFLAATNKTLLQNSGYVQFVDTDDEDIETPIVETPKLPHLLPSSVVLLLSEVGETSDTPDPHSLDVFNNGKNLGVVMSDVDDESYLQPEGTTTDDTTTSDLVTIKDNPFELCDTSFGDSFYTPGEPDHGVSRDSPPGTGIRDDASGATYEEYVRRIQGRVSPFSNVRDSIDIRKARKPGAVGAAGQLKAVRSQQDRISEEVVVPADVRLPPPPQPAPGGGGISQKLEELSRDRSKQKDLVHEMVMGKISGGRRSQERKAKRSITRVGSMSPSLPPPPCNHSDSAPGATRLDTSLPADVATTQLPIIKSYTGEPKSLPLPTVDSVEKRHGFLRDITTPGVEREEFFTPMTSFKKTAEEAALRHRPLSVHSSFRGQRPAKFVGKPATLPLTPLTNPEAFSCPDITHALQRSPDDPFRTPVAPPRGRTDDAKRTVDREQARLRARLKSDEELGLSPEDYIRALKEKVQNRPGARLREPIEPLRTLDIGSNIFPRNTTTNPLFVDSDPASRPHDDAMTCEHMRGAPGSEPGSPVSAPACLTPTVTRERKKSKDPERRKSGIIQAVSDFFHKKKDASRSPSPPPQKESKEKFSRFKFAAKARDRNKSAYTSSDDSDQEKPKASVASSRSKSFEDRIDRQPFVDSTPPPVPPPPANYLGNGAIPRKSEDSMSEPEDDSHATAASTPSHGPGSSAEANSSSKRHSRMNQRMSRQIQLKRHRMAQEIQRQLEELEVKQRELERRGVGVEKALRGEGSAEAGGGGGGEEELLREWFELMREQGELKRYERELLLRAEELELEDRHTRLQQDLRDKMSKDDASKSSEDVVKEGQILAEMLDIVERKDSLVHLLEEDRLRHLNEGRDLEAQMLAKGLRVTPLRQESHV